jgi:CheY-like chemotaxis protein
MDSSMAQSQTAGKMDVKPQVLLVDDEEMVISLYKDVLFDAGFDVDSANSGNEALEKVAQKKYDIVLLDIMMPEMGGIETLRLIRSDETKYGHPVVVMLTNIAMADQIRDANDAGAEGYLVKLSLSNDQLVEKVYGFLKGFKK